MSSARLAMAMWLYLLFLTSVQLLILSIMEFCCSNYVINLALAVLYLTGSFLSGRFKIVYFASDQSSGSILTCGVPQGSVSGQLIFSLYTTDVVRTAYSFGVRVHYYVDDLQLYVHCWADDAVAAVARLLACSEAIYRWMGSNQLKMNPDKTQFIWLGSPQQLTTVNKRFFANMTALSCCAIWQRTQPGNLLRLSLDDAWPRKLRHVCLFLPTLLAALCASFSIQRCC